MKPVLEVQHLTKEFLIGGQHEPYLSLRDVISNPFRKLRQPEKKQFRALDDVSFEVMPGDSIGIIGRNGAGKSTLLKILSNITPPTSGKITCRGRIASLLEVGTGFHTELTGRENIYMNGSILGMRRAEISRHFDEIVDFSGVEKFLDTPLKRYSSGMQLRLAFAVAAHLEPEILIVDEVLAVGDAEFQKKCLGKMDEVVKQKGRTVLFVSHNMGGVRSLCNLGFVLHSGKLDFRGDVEKAINRYFQQNNSLSSSSITFEEGCGDETARLTHALFTNCSGGDTFFTGEEIICEVEYEVLKPGAKPLVNLHFINDRGEYAFASIDNSLADVAELLPGKYKAKLVLPPLFMNNAVYSVDIHLTTLTPTTTHYIAKEAISIDIMDSYDFSIRQGYNGFFPGAVRPLLKWESARIG